MLQHQKKKVSRRAIEYLATVSDLSRETEASVYASGQQSKKRQDKDRINEDRNQEELLKTLAQGWPSFRL